MCLAVPGVVLSVEEGAAGLRFGEVGFGGIRRRVCLACTPEARVGDYVLVHVGFSIATVDEAAAREIFEDLRRLGDLAEIEDGGEGRPEAGADSREGPA